MEQAKHRRVRKPNGILYFLVYIFLMPFLKITFRLEIDRKNYKPPKGPFIAICNHGSFMDFAIAMLALYPRRLNAVAAQKFFLFKPLNWFLPLMGAIPKNLFDADVRAIVGIKKVIERGGRILLFPEGRCECDGVYVGMHTATGKLFKNIKVPVVSCSIDGAYKCMPFWRKGLRFGRVRIVISNLFSKEDLHTMSVEQINRAVDKRLSREEDPPPKKPFRTFSTRQLAEGLENLIYWCPKCNREFTLATDNSIVYCTNCGDIAEIDNEMKFIPKTPNCAFPRGLHEWFRAQAQYESQKLHKDMTPVTVEANIRLPAKKQGDGMDTCGSALVRLDPKGWYIDGEIRGEKVNLFFPIETVPALPLDPNDVFQIYAHGTFYCIAPINPQESVKYSVIGECAYWKFASNIRMTPRKDSGFSDVSGGRFS